MPADRRELPAAASNGFLSTVDLHGQLGKVNTGLEGQFHDRARDIEAIVKAKRQDRLVYTMLACRGVMPARETFAKAKRAARQALQIEPDLGEACASLAHVRLHDWDWIGLELDFQRAIELNPGHAIAYYWYAEYLMAMGRDDEAIARVKQSRQMDPLNSVLNSSVGMILYLARQFDQAKEEFDKALDIDPNHFLLHFRLGLVYQQQKRFQEAIEEM
jgi:tetratricopeptide (TPR) repeat protein